MLEGEPAATPVISNDRPYTVRVRFPAGNRVSLEAMRNTLLISSSGHTATLGALATLAENCLGRTEIRRENLQRDVSVTARLEGLDLGSGIGACRRRLTILHMPASIRVEYGGTYQEQQKSFHDLVSVLMLAIVLVFIVLLFEFGSFAAPLAILASAMLSTSGVFIRTADYADDVQRVVVHGHDHGDRHRGEERHSAARCGSEIPQRWDRPREDAMLQAGRRRLRPIVMTALATIAGMLPLAFASVQDRRCCNRWPSRSSAGL